jgi:hypothetical protein
MKKVGLNVIHVDRVGAGVSFACAIHCAVVPFAATILPLLGIGFLADERIERMVLVVSIALASVSICWGFSRHRRRRVLILFGAALSLIALGRGVLSGTSEMVTVVTGATLFSVGHLLNHRLCQSCTTCANQLPNH